MSGQGTALRRLWRVTAHDLRVLHRHRVIAAVAVVTGVWVVLLRLAPLADRAVLLPLVVYADAGVIGLVFVGGHVLVERRDRVIGALGVSPLQPSTYVLGKLSALTVTAAVASGVLVAAAGGAHPLAPLGILPAVALLSLVALATSLVVAARARDVTAYLILAQLPLAPALLPLAAQAGWLPWRLADIVPTAGPMRVLSAVMTGQWPVPQAWVGMLYAGAVAVLLVRAAARGTDRHLFHVDLPHSPLDLPSLDLPPADLPPADLPPADGAASVTTAHIGRRPVRTLVVRDLHSGARQPVLCVLVAAPFAMALLARVGVPILSREAAVRLARDVSHYRPTVLALMLIVAALLFGTIAALQLIEDRDEGTLQAELLTPVPRSCLLGRRALMATVASGLGLVVAVPLSDLGDVGLMALLPAVVVASLVAPVVALLLPAVARDRLEALAVMKGITLPALAPLLSPWLDGPAGVLVRLPPTWWVVAAVEHAQPNGSPSAFGGAALTSGAGVVVLTAVTLLLYAGTRRRLLTQPR